MGLGMRFGDSVWLWQWVSPRGVYIKLQIFGVGGAGWSGWGVFCSFMYSGCKLRKVDLPGWVRVDLLGWVWVDLLGWARQYGRSESGKALRF